MKKLFAIALIFAVAACASTLPFNDQVAYEIRAVTLVRTTATALLRANKITLEQDQVIQAQADLARKGIEIARSMQKEKPQDAAAQLEASKKIVEALSTQTGAKP